MRLDFSLPVVFLLKTLRAFALADFFTAKNTVPLPTPSAKASGAHYVFRFLALPTKERF